MGVVKYTGPIASFHCPTNAEIRSLKVHFSPKQLGEGTPSPENVREIQGWDGVEAYRCGKNLLNPKDNPIWDDGRYTINDDNTVTIKNSDGRGWTSSTQIKPFPLKKGTYTFSWTGSPRVQFATSEDNYETVTTYSKYSFTFTLSEDGFIKWKHTSSSTDYPLIITVQIEEGSTATLYEPYRGSTTNYEFGVLGKNKFDYSTANIINNKRRDDTGAVVPDASGSYCQTLIPVKPNTTYTVSGYAVNNDSKRIYYIDAEENFIARTAIFGTSSYTFTTPNNCYYIQIQNREVGNNASWETVQLELGSTATVYEPYNPNHTVYGGWVDLISGEVQEEWNTICVKDLPGKWNYNSNNIRFQITLPSQYLNGVTGIWNSKNIMSEAYQTSTTSNGFGGNKQIAQYSNRYIYIRDNDFEGDVDAFLAAVGDTKIAYKLPTAISYALAPTSLQTFLSQNNIWSNADYVEVEYDLHETQSILARKQFIIANQPHVVTPAAAPLQSFETDMAAPVKECKVYFKPVQDLHGYSKPWVGGSGKNLFNINATEQNPDNTAAANTTARNFTAGTYCVGTSWSNWLQPNQILEYSVSNGILSVKNNNVYGIGYALKVESETDYAISATSSGGGVHAAFYDASGNFISGLSTNLLNTSFATPVDAVIVVLTFFNRSAGSDAAAATFSNIQFEKNSSVTSYEPYENICPIEGWTAVSLQQTKKNIVNFIETSLGPYSAYQNGYYGWCRELTSLNQLVGQKVTYSAYIDATNTNTGSINDARIWGKYKDGTWAFLARSGNIIANGTTGQSSVTVTIPNNLAWIAFGYSLNIGAIISNPMVEVGDTATAFEPYNGTTIPITFPSVINALSSTTITANKTLSSAGEEISESGMSLTNYIKVNEGDTYKLTFTSKEGARTRRIYGYDANKEPVESLASASWVNVDSVGTLQATIPSGVEYIRVCYKTADTNISLIGPESSIFYGGYVDLANGELVQTHCVAVIDEHTTIIQERTSHGVKTEIYSLPYVGTNENAIFTNGYDIRQRSSASWNYPTALKLYLNPDDTNVTSVVFGIPDMNMTQAEWIDWLSKHGPIQIYYKLLNPIHYSLSSTQLKTLKGVNNIWSNSNGDITVQFWTH